MQEVGGSIPPGSTTSKPAAFPRQVRRSAQPLPAHSTRPTTSRLSTIYNRRDPCLVESRPGLLRNCYRICLPRSCGARLKSKVSASELCVLHSARLNQIMLAVKWAVAACAAATPALAQQAPPAQPAQPQQVQEVVVTGSRILQSVAQSTQPLSVISSDQIEKTGLASVGDLLQQ